MLVELLAGEGYAVELAADGQRGLHLALTHEYDALVIDRGLPALDGLDLLVRLRRSGIAAGVLLLTAFGTLDDRVAGLDAGAEDYLVKPFEVAELLARLRALLRRGRPIPGAALAGVVLDAERRVALVSDREVELTGREFDLAALLASRPRTVFSRAELRRRVFRDAPAESIVDTYVYYLRRKLGHDVIRTVRGLGYQAGRP